MQADATKTNQFSGRTNHWATKYHTHKPLQRSILESFTKWANRSRFGLPAKEYEIGMEKACILGTKPRNSLTKHTNKHHWGDLGKEAGQCVEVDSTSPLERPLQSQTRAGN
jgi:hypothetical protein